MTEKIYNKKVRYRVFYYAGFFESDDMVIDPYEELNSEFASEYMEYFGKNNPCRYISLLSHKIFLDNRDRFYKIWGKHLDYYDVCYNVIVFLSEREEHDKPSNIELGEDNELHLVDESVEGLLADLEFLQQYFNYWMCSTTKAHKEVNRNDGTTTPIEVY